MAMEDTTGMSRSNAHWTIDITEAAQKRGIDNAYQLWQKIGGSKSTSVELFNGVKGMIRTETMNRLHKELGMLPWEYIKNVGDDGN